jgi:hypothetical protein
MYVDKVVGELDSAMTGTVFAETQGEGTHAP